MVSNFSVKSLTSSFRDAINDASSALDGVDVTAGVDEDDDDEAAGGGGGAAISAVD